MYFKQIQAPGLGCYSYVVGCPGAKAMAVIDPKRDVQDYLDIARDEGMRIELVIDTHVHADHVSGAHELRSHTGCELGMYETSPVDFPFRKLKEGEVIEMGNAKLEILHTPGHTPDALSVLVTDQSRSDEPWMLLTGDVLFVGDIGRPDLAGSEVLDEQVRNLYNSLYVKFAKFPDHLEVFPSHGSGSLCGRGMSSKPSSTLGYERRHNPMLQFDGFEAFALEMSGQFPTRPKSFTHIISTNKDGAPLLECCPMEKAMSPERFEELMNDGALVIDARDSAAFGGFHIPGSLNIGLEKSLANWMGMVVNPNTDFILVTDSRAGYEAMVVEMHRIGYDRIFGYLNGSITSWVLSGRPVDRLEQVPVRELAGSLDHNAPTILDVRTPAEIQAGAIPGSVQVALPDVLDGKHDPAPDAEVVVYCGSGYRSNIAASALKGRGHNNVRSLAGGFTAWSQAGLPVS